MIPTTLLGSSISQVYLSRVALEMAEGRLTVFTLSTMKHLAFIGIFPLVAIGLMAPTIFPFIFGNEWKYAGDIASWLVPWAILQLIASPVSMVMHVTGRQKSMLALTLFGGCMRLTLVYLAHEFSGTEGVVEIFAIGSAIFYGFCCITFAVASGWRPEQKDLRILILFILTLVIYITLILIR
jgi:O-antigen/teichoic acid export membrane protein